MSIQDFIVASDKFEPDDRLGSLSFPCCACVHRHGDVEREPCRTCGHNVNAVLDEGGEV